MNPRVAIVLPTCNRLGMLKRAMRSLEAQEFKDFVVYISDDASTDGTRLLGSSDFPQLNVQVIRQLKSFPTLPDHFSYLFYSAKEEIVVMAHDDEVYHPSWIANMVACFDDPSVVFAFGQTVTVDAKTSLKKYFVSEGKFTEGLYSGMELRKYVLTRKLDLPANGFAVRSSAVQQITPLVATYEQFDYEWMIRLADQGKTRVIPELTSTYTVHRSNTVGSRKYLLRLLHQKSAPQMLDEWLAETPDLTPAEKSDARAWLDHGHAHLDWLMFLKALGYGETDLGRTYGQRFITRPQASPARKALVQVALLPGLSTVANKLLGAVFRHRAISPMRRKGPTLDPAELIPKFPTIALFDDPL